MGLRMVDKSSMTDNVSSPMASVVTSLCRLVLYYRMVLRSHCNRYTRLEKYERNSSYAERVLNGEFMSDELKNIRR